MGSERQEKYRIATRFVDNKVVEKIALTNLCREVHLKQITKNEQALKRYGRDVLESKWDDTGKIVSDFVKKPLLEDKVLEA